MGKVEECVERKLSEHGTPGEKPSKQDLAIKFQECRDDHPGGDSGFSESKENQMMGYPDQDFDQMKFAGSMDEDIENEDVNAPIAQRMHEAQFNQKLVTEAETIKMINDSKIWTQENKSSVLGMAYNYHNKIFGEEDQDDIIKGNSFSNDVAQEMYKTTLEIVADWPHKTLTNEFLISQLAARGYDPVMATEFVKNALEVTLYPNVANIPQTDPHPFEVPNQNARTDFKPRDIMMGDVPREDLDADTITPDPAPPAPPMFKDDPNKEDDEERTEINQKNSKRSGNQDLASYPTNDSDRPSNDNIGERLGWVANSTMAHSPEAEDMGGMTQSLDQTLGPPDTMQTPGPCDPGKTLNPVTGVCEEISLAKVESPDLGVTAGIPGSTENLKKNY